jgi:hypothetical protein
MYTQGSQYLQDSQYMKYSKQSPTQLGVRRPARHRRRRRLLVGKLVDARRGQGEQRRERRVLRAGHRQGGIELGEKNQQKRSEMDGKWSENRSENGWETVGKWMGNGRKID